MSPTPNPKKSWRSRWWILPVLGLLASVFSLSGCIVEEHDHWHHHEEWHEHEGWHEHGGHWHHY